MKSGLCKTEKAASQGGKPEKKNLLPIKGEKSQKASNDFASCGEGGRVPSPAMNDSNEQSSSAPVAVVKKNKKKLLTVKAAQLRCEWLFFACRRHICLTFQQPK